MRQRNCKLVVRTDIPPSTEPRILTSKLNPQGHGDALELSPVWETKDSYTGKQAPRCGPNLAKCSEEREKERGHRMECYLRGREEATPALGSLRRLSKSLKSEVISEEQIDFQSLEQGGCYFIAYRQTLRVKPNEARPTQ